MKKLLALLLAISMVFTLVACGGEKKTAEKTEKVKGFEELQAEYQTKTAEDLINEYIKDKAKPTDEEVIALAKTGAYAALNDKYYFDYNITDEALDLLTDEQVDSAYPINFAKALIEDEEKLVRAYGYGSFSEYVPLDNEELENFLIEKVKTETDNTVIACALRGLQNALSERPEFADFAVECAKNDDPVVRYWAASALGFFRLEDNEKYVDTLITLIDDSDADVVEIACKEIGGLGNEKAVAALETILADESLVDVHGPATESLEALWMNFPFYDGASEAAYRAHIAYLGTESTNPEIPSWLAVASITNPGGSYETWKSASTYFDVAEVIAVLTKIVGDADVDKLAKTTAIQKISAFGTVEDLEALKAVVAGSADEAALLDSIETNIASNKN